MKIVLKYLTISAILMVFACGATAKRLPGRIAELDAMSNKELITSVDLDKYADLIRAFQVKEATRLLNSTYNPKRTGVNIETYRNKEVIIITIPTDRLFSPNSTELCATAESLLIPLKRYMKAGTEDLYRVLMVVHTDNTGSETYTDKLSMDRAASVFNWFVVNGCNTDYLFPRASGASEPNLISGELTDLASANDTMEKRAANRRLEVYLIPGERMIDMAKRGRIAF